MLQTPLWCFQMGTPESPSRLCYLKADRAKRTLHVLNLLPQLADPEDILLINLGIHYNEMDDLADDMTMVGFALGKYELPRHRIWVETPPQHFETPTGEGLSPHLLAFPAMSLLAFPAMSPELAAVLVSSPQGEGQQQAAKLIGQGYDQLIYLSIIYKSVYIIYMFFSRSIRKIDAPLLGVTE